MKYLDACIGAPLMGIVPVPEECEVINPSTFLLIRPGGIGDAVLLAPVIISIKKKYPQSRITVLAERRNSEIFSLVPDADGVLCYDRPRELLYVLRGSYDVVIDTEQWHRLSAVVARLMTSPVKIGFATNERLRMFTHQIPYSHDSYETFVFARLLEPLGIEVDGVEWGTPFLTIPAAQSCRASELLISLHEAQFITIFPGASIPERQWGAERFRRVAELLAVFGIGVVVVGGKEDCRQGEIITAGGVGVNLAGMTSLAGTAAVIQKSSLLLSGDSGVLHIAVGLGVPTVSLFGPGRAEKWAPRGDHHLVINKNYPCSPCTTFGTTPPCPENVACMRDITVEEVFNSVTMLLTSTGAMASRCCKREWIEAA